MGRFQIYGTEDAIAEIDAAAEAAGESRSEYMVSAALDRARGAFDRGLTTRQKRALRAAREALDRIDDD